MLCSIQFGWRSIPRRLVIVLAFKNLASGYMAFVGTILVGLVVQLTTSAHPDNYIGIPGMLDALSSLSNAWAAKYPSEPKLRYNGYDDIRWRRLRRTQS